MFKTQVNLVYIGVRFVKLQHEKDYYGNINVYDAIANVPLTLIDALQKSTNIPYSVDDIAGISVDGMCINNTWKVYSLYILVKNGSMSNNVLSVKYIPIISSQFDLSNLDYLFIPANLGTTSRKCYLDNMRNIYSITTSRTLTPYTDSIRSNSLVQKLSEQLVCHLFSKKEEYGLVGFLDVLGKNGTSIQTNIVYGPIVDPT